MNKGIDGLLRYLVQQIALQNKIGATPEYVIKAVSEFYSESDITIQDGLRSGPWELDPLYLDQVWTWLLQSPDVYLRTEIEQARIDEARALRAKELRDHGLEAKRHQLSLVDVQRANEKALRPKPRNNAKADQTGKAPPRHYWRLYTSDEQMWFACAGHGIDIRRIPALELQLLLIIANCREDGILQPQLVKVSGQDKRSVPNRTKNLAEHGYVVKRTAHIPGSVTSRIILKRHAAAHDNRMASDSKRETWAYRKFGRHVAIIKSVLQHAKDAAGQEISWKDLRAELDLGNDHTIQAKNVIDALIRLQHLGCADVVRVSNSRTRAGKIPRIDAVKFTRDLTNEDWKKFWDLPMELTRQSRRTKRESSAISRNDSSDTRSPSVGLGPASSSNPKSKGLVKYKTRTWQPDRTMADLVFAAVRDAGARGITNAEAVQTIAGSFYYRPISNLLVSLSDSQWHNRPFAAPQLQIIRDVTAFARYTAFIFYGFEGFRTLVRNGEKAWEDVHRSEPKSDEPGPYDFAELPENLFSTSGNTLADCCRHGKAMPMIAPPPKAKKQKGLLHQFEGHSQAEGSGQSDTGALLELTQRKRQRGTSTLIRKYKYKLMEEHSREEWAALNETDRWTIVNNENTLRRYHVRKLVERIESVMENTGLGLDDVIYGLRRELEHKTRLMSIDRRSAPWQQLRALPETERKLRNALYYPSKAAHMVFGQCPMLKDAGPAAIKKPRNLNRKPGTKAAKPAKSAAINPVIGYFASTGAHSITMPNKELVAHDRPQEKSRRMTAKSAIRLLYKQKYRPSVAAHSNFSHAFLTKENTQGKTKKRAAAKKKTATRVSFADGAESPGKAPTASPAGPAKGILATPQQDLNVSRHGRQRRQTVKALDSGAPEHVETVEDSVAGIKGRPPRPTASVGALSYSDMYKWDKVHPRPGVYLGPPCSVKRETKGRGKKALLLVVQSGKLRDPALLQTVRPPTFIQDVVEDSRRRTVSRAHQVSTPQVERIVNSVQRTEASVTEAAASGPTEATVQGSKRKRGSHAGTPERDEKRSKATASPVDRNSPSGPESAPSPMPTMIREDSAAYQPTARSNVSNPVKPGQTVKHGEASSSAGISRPRSATKNMAQQEAGTNTPQAAKTGDISDRVMLDAPILPVTAGQNSQRSANLWTSVKRVGKPDSATAKLDAFAPLQAKNAVGPIEMLSQDQLSIDQEVTTPKESKKKQVTWSPVPAQGILPAPDNDSTDASLIGSPRKPKPKGRSQRPPRTGVTRHGGTPNAIKGQIIFNVIRDAGGCMPNGRSLLYAFTTQWRKRMNITEAPDLRTLTEPVKRLVDANKIRRYKLILCNNSKGQPVEAEILTLPDVDYQDSTVQALKEGMKKDHPRCHIPKGMEIDVDLRGVIDLEEQRQERLATLAALAEARTARATPGRKALTEEQKEIMRRKRQETKQIRMEQELRDAEAADVFGTQLFTVGNYDPGFATSKTRRQARAGRKQFDSDMNPSNKRESMKYMFDLDPALLKGDGPHFIPSDMQRRARTTALHELNRDDFGSYKFSYEQPHQRPAQRMARVPQRKSGDSSGHAGVPMQVTGQHLMRLVGNLPAQMEMKQRFFGNTGTFGTFMTISARFVPQSVDDILEHRWPEQPHDRKPQLYGQHEHVMRTFERIRLWESTDPQAMDVSPLGYESFINVTVDTDIGPSQRRLTAAQRRILGESVNRRRSAPGKRRRRRRSTATTSRGPSHVDRITGMKRPGVRLNDEPAAKRAKTTHRRQRPRDPLTDKRMLLAVLMSKILFRAGDVRFTDWGIAGRLLGNKYEVSHIKRRYTALRGRWKGWMVNTKKEIEESFLVAYEAGDLPQVMYDDIEGTEWVKIMAWLEKQVAGQQSAKLQVGHKAASAQISRLPKTREALSNSFDIETKVVAANNNDKFEIKVKGMSAIMRRYKMHETPDVLPVAKSTTSPVITNSIIARSWIRASALTSHESYQPMVAKEKLLSAPELDLNQAFSDLLNQRAIRRFSRQTDRRSVDITASFVSGFRTSIQPSFYEHAAEFKADLDRIFKQGRHPEFDPLAKEGHMIALINMFAEGQISLHSKDMPSQPMGLLKGSYKTRSMDKNLLVFPVEIRPTAQYEQGLPQRVLSRKPSGPKQTARDGRDLTPLPVWLDIHGDEAGDVFRHSASTVIAVTLMRPGLSAERLAKYAAPALEAWDIEIIMRWAVESGLADWVGENRKGIQMKASWWMWYMMNFQLVKRARDPSTEGEDGRGKRARSS